MGSFVLSEEELSEEGTVTWRRTLMLRDVTSCIQNRKVQIKSEVDTKGAPAGFQVFAYLL